jgi:hypothetical protein
MYRWSGALNLCQGTSTLLMDWLELTFTSIDPLTAPASLHFLGLDPSCIVFTGCTHTDRPGFDASISSVTLVPDTGSTALLLTAAFGALVRMRRRHLL